MTKRHLEDWNDVRLLLACAEKGGFAGAAVALGIDPASVSRRISELEAAVGRPLFHRRRSGATPTAAGLALVELARNVGAAMSRFEGAVTGLRHAPPPAVTIAAPEGILSYTLIPLLLGNTATAQPLDPRMIRGQLPPLAFTSMPDRGDVAVVVTSLEALPNVRGAVRVRRVGIMSFVPGTDSSFLRNCGDIASFDALAAKPLVDVGVYRPVPSLDAWNGLVASRHEQGLSTLPTTRLAHKALLEGKGVTILPTYSPMYDSRIVPLDIRSPTLAVSLWLVSHEDKLREPAIRTVYDVLAELFLSSPWFRGVR